MAVNLQKVGIGVIILLKVDEAKQKAREQEAAVQQAQAGSFKLRLPINKLSPLLQNPGGAYCKPKPR